MSKFRDYAQLIKLRLSLLVVFSALASYCLVADPIDPAKMFFLAIGGLLVTGAANGFNEILERDLDKLMNRTNIRPIPDGRMRVNEAIICAVFMLIVGSVLLWKFTNPVCLLICLLAFSIYVFVYTPLKPNTPFAVLVGAFPGALPVMIGSSAHEPAALFSITSWLLFGIQFVWQFPHFWSIAWVLHDDYLKAGFRLLPVADGKSKGSAFQILFYTLLLLPVSLLPIVFTGSGWITGIAASVGSLIFIGKSIKLYRSCSDKDARSVMFWSFAYLPLILSGMMVDKAI